MKRHPYAALVRDSYKRLRVYQSRWADLTYPEGDPRGVKADSEMMPHELVKRATLIAETVYRAAIVGGESPESARCYADQPLATDNPYRLERVRVALSLHWPIPEWVLARARWILAERATKAAEQTISGLQAATERLVL